MKWEVRDFFDVQIEWSVFLFSKVFKGFVTLIIRMNQNLLHFKQKLLKFHGQIDEIIIN